MSQICSQGPTHQMFPGLATPGAQRDCLLLFICVWIKMSLFPEMTSLTNPFKEEFHPVSLAIIFYIAVCFVFSLWFHCLKWFYFFTSLESICLTIIYILWQQGPCFLCPALYSRYIYNRCSIFVEWMGDELILVGRGLERIPVLGGRGG